MATKTFNLAFDETLLSEVDGAAHQDMASRSEYFRRLALADLARRRQRRRNQVWDALGDIVGDVEDAAAQAGYTSDADFTRLAAEIRSERH